jgi:Ca2+-binding EF-hand superfamily protein
VSEFQQLFDYINQWKQTFQGFDSDRSGKIEQSELNQAFQQMGYRFSPTFVQNLLSKYDPRSRKLTLDNFIVACVQIKRLTDSFRSRDRQMQGTATLAYEDFIGLAMGAHK